MSFRLFRAHDPRAILALWLVVLAMMASATASAADWTQDLPPAVTNPFNGAVFSADGDMLYATNQESNFGVDVQVVRVTAAGTARWAVNIPAPYDRFGTLPNGVGILPYTDGSALVASGGFIARIDAAGAIAWSRNVSVGSIKALDAQTFAASTCNAVTLFDLSTGNIRWQYFLAGPGSQCTYGSLAVDASGYVYSAFASGVAAAPPLHIVKLDAAGHLLWDAQDVSSVGVLLQAVDNAVYFETQQELRAYRVGDGSRAWSHAFTYQDFNAVRFAGSPAEPVVVEGAGLTRLDPANGNPRWSRSLGSNVYPEYSTTFGGDVVVGAHTGSFESLFRVDGGSGQILWTSTLSDTSGSGAFVQWHGLGVWGANTLCATGIAAQAVALERIDPVNGNLLGAASLPSIPQALDGSVFREDATHLVLAAATHSSPLDQIVVRRIDAQAGAQLWSTAFATIGSSHPIAGIANANGQVVLAAASNGSGTSTFGAAVVAAFDDQTGMLRWQRTIYDPDGQGVTDVSAPLIDAQGDVLISYAASVLCAFGANVCPVAYVVKLSGSDGSQLWSFDATQANQSPSYPYHPRFTLSGTHVVVSGPFAGMPGTGLVGLADDSGAVQWSSLLFAQWGSDLISFANGDVIADGDGWARIDPATGNTVWENARLPWGCMNPNLCSLRATVGVSGDGILLAGEADGHPHVELLPGTAGATQLTWNLPPADMSLHSFALGAWPGSTDQVWLQLRNLVWNSGSGLDVLASFDTISGTLSGQQVISSYIDDPIVAGMFPSLLGAPQAGLVLAGGMSKAPPQPTTAMSAAFDTTVRAHGNITTSLQVPGKGAQRGGLIDFHIVVKYTGDAALDTVTTLAHLPWPADPASLTCVVQAAANCNIDPRSGNLRVTAAMQSGGSIDVSGAMRVLDGPESRKMFAFAFGDPGLVEPDTLDNFGQIALAESIFADGFE